MLTRAALTDWSTGHVGAPAVVAALVCLAARWWWRRREASGKQLGSRRKQRRQLAGALRKAAQKQGLDMEAFQRAGVEPAVLSALAVALESRGFQRQQIEAAIMGNTEHVLSALRKGGNPDAAADILLQGEEEGGAGDAPAMGSAGAGGGAGAMSAAQMEALLAKAGNALRVQQGTGEAQVQSAMDALGYVTQVMRQTRGGEAGVIAALEEAAAKNREVKASDTCPGAGWTFLVPPELQEEDSLLAETGREGIIQEAAADPDSYICPQCGGVVSRRRKIAHDQYWCEPEGLEGPEGPEPEPMPMD